MNRRETNQNKKGKNILLGCLSIFAILILSIVGAGLYAQNYYNDAVNMPFTETANNYELQITEGESLISTLEKLESEGVIKSALALQVYFRLESINPNIKFGTYTLDSNYSIDEFISVLETGTLKKGIIVTIPEGLRYDEIGLILQDKLSTTNFSLSEYNSIVENPELSVFSEKTNSFLQTAKLQNQSLEGYLFPDTYEFAEDVSTLKVIDIMISNMATKLEAVGVNFTNNPQPRLNNFYEVITLASIVEREALLEVDKQQVSDIFLKRLESGITLGSDVTLAYYLGRWSPEPDFYELQIDTLYNTRLYAGLTPTPINSPGIESILAVIEPMENNYYFFIADAEGIVRYAETLPGHQYNIDTFGLIQ